MRFPAIALAFLCTALPVSAVTPQEAASRIEAKLLAARSLRSEYEHLYYSMTASEPLREKGRLLFQKPDRMRWDSREPEAQTFLYKDGLILFYIPEEKQLIRSRASGDRSEFEILALLSGRKSLTDAYVVDESPFPTEAKDAVQVRLTPKVEGEFTYILLETDAATWLIRKAVFFDWAGNKQEFRFSRIEVDPRLAPELFDLKVPPGTEVIEDDASLER
ncbi:MAG TPA: outer membrane lipoprotein carrier protein LolA [Acidobacteriota bacterium]|nr:outer membrane lipoprotein carrier protein LolA [Acidobacteriota bacterium]